jgi:hypothetical protein
MVLTGCGGVEGLMESLGIVVCDEGGDVLPGVSNGGEDAQASKD